MIPQNKDSEPSEELSVRQGSVQILRLARQPALAVLRVILTYLSETQDAGKSGLGKKVSGTQQRPLKDEHVAGKTAVA